MKISFLRLPAVMLLLLAGWLQARGQSALPYVISSSTGSAPASGGSTVDFTLGEAVISTIGTNPVFTQGFEQPNTTGNPLPVQWLDFTGTVKNGYNLLNWHTAQEKNNDYFNVERSPDGISFSPIGRIYSKAAGGNSTTALAYNYPDKTMATGINYYRLQQVDKDQRSSYSLIVRLENNAAAQSFTLSPNPTRGKVLLTIKAPSAQAQAQISDINGKEMKTIRITEQVTEIDLSAFASGTYFIRYADGPNSESVKIVKD